MMELSNGRNAGMADGIVDKMAEWWNGGMADGMMAEWLNGRMAEWRPNGGMVKWQECRNGGRNGGQNGRMAEWQNGGMAPEWWNG